MIPSIGFTVDSPIANLHVVPNDPFKQLSPEQQAAAKRDLVKALEKVLKKSTKTYLPDLSKKKRKPKIQKVKST